MSVENGFNVNFRVFVVNNDALADLFLKIEKIAEMDRSLRDE